MQVKWVIFDLNGTLLDPLPISRDLPAPLNDTATALSLLNDTVFQAMADTLAGPYRPFSGYLAAAVARRLILAGCEPGPAVDEAVNSTVTAAGCLPPFAEAGQALAILADRGLRIATITNSPTAAAERALTAGGLRHRFEHVVGSDTCQAYKPALKVYVSGLRLIGADPGQACMVAAHGWDLLGAHQAGMQTAWVSRGEQQWLTSLPTPDVTGADLLAVARAIIAA